MTRQDELKLDRYKQKAWRSRVERERGNISASVEATLADLASQEDMWEDELDAPVMLTGPAPQDNAVIPPRLSLQSKIVPAQYSGPTEEGAAPLPKPGTNLLAQFAQRITSSLSALGGSRQPTSPIPQTPGPHAAPVAAPLVEPEPALPGIPVVAADVPPSKKNAPHVGVRSEKQRLAGHTTKVRLEAAPKLEVGQAPVWFEKPATALEATTNPSILALGKAGERTETAAPHMLAGSGVFERGQRELAVAHTHITGASVVVVMLTGDPGPVVVQYISLQPRVGFTVHLSAPTEKKTPFNYAIFNPAASPTVRP
ncbi:MAG: hypothetical protein H0W02_06945 [Ktedonobacteraceae bacterium]|nr:hypothetical protein [Ktedonobacteraceae bacterium]